MILAFLYLQVKGSYGGWGGGGGVGPLTTKPVMNLIFPSNKKKWKQNIYFSLLILNLVHPPK